MMRAWRTMIVASVAAVMVTVGGAARADEPGSGAPPALPPHRAGPARIDLGNGVEIDLPAGMRLFEREEAQRIERADGNDADRTVAVIVQPGAGVPYAIVVDFDDAGHVDDDDAGGLDATALLAQMRDNTRRQNATRRQMKLPELFVDGWLDQPRYVAGAHQLAWGLRLHDSSGPLVNSVTKTLGRTGVVSIIVIATSDQIAAAQTAARPAIDAIHFRPGARYEDFVPDQDRSSGFGLTGLIVGGTAVTVGMKSGFFIKLLLVLKKLIIVIVAGVGGFFRWLFRRKTKAPPAPPPAPPAHPDAGGST